MLTMFTPSASTLFLKLDHKLSNWYEKSNGEGKKAFFERAGKSLVIAPVHLAMGTVGVLALAVYDLVMSVVWGLAALFTKFHKNQGLHINLTVTALAHLNSLGSAASLAINHIAAAIFFPFSAAIPEMTRYAQDIQDVQTSEPLFNHITEGLRQDNRDLRADNRDLLNNYGRLSTENQQLRNHLLDCKDRYGNQLSGNETFNLVVDLVYRNIQQDQHQRLATHLGKVLQERYDRDQQPILNDLDNNNQIDNQQDNNEVVNE